MSKINKIRLSGTDYDIQDVSATSVVEVTQQQYDDLPASAKTDNILYIITDSTVDYVTSAQTQSAITQAVSGKADADSVYTKTETDNALANKQTTLTAGTGIAITNNVISTTGGGNSVVELTQAAYDALVTGGTVDPDTFYIITDAEAGDLTNYYTKSETDNAITAATATKQDTLVSGTNIKTINNESLLGSGNIDIQGGGGGKAIEAGRGISITTGATADTVSFSLPISAGTRNDNITCCGSNTVSGQYAVSFGNSNTTKGTASLTFGRSCSTNNYDNVAGGFGVTTKGNQASSFGQYTKTENEAEHSVGRYNVSNKANDTFGNSGNTLFSVGNGTANNARHNAFEIRQNGDIYLTLDGQDVKLQDQLGGGGSSYTAGDGIDITNNVISVTGKVDTSAITSSVTSASTDSEIPSAKAVYDQLGGLKLVKLTQAEYNALSPNYDSNTLYVING